MRQRAAATLPSLIRSLTKEGTTGVNQAGSLPSRRLAFSLYDLINFIDNVVWLERKLMAVEFVNFRSTDGNLPVGAPYSR
ncbi:hypothetical protein QQ045_029766 [Rhodiola kirilowii]